VSRNRLTGLRLVNFILLVLVIVLCCGYGLYAALS
jgi:hypothetical protein